MERGREGMHMLREEEMKEGEEMGQGVGEEEDVVMG